MAKTHKASKGTAVVRQTIEATTRPTADTDVVRPSMTVHGVRITPTFASMIALATGAVHDAARQIDELHRMAQDVFRSSFDRAEIIRRAWDEFQSMYQQHNKTNGTKIKATKHAFARALDPTVPERSEDAARQGNTTMNAINYLFRVYDRVIASRAAAALTQATTEEEREVARAALFGAGTKRAIVAALRDASSADSDWTTRLDLDIPADIKEELTKRPERTTLTTTEQRDLAFALVTKLVPEKIMPSLWPLIGNVIGMDSKATGKLRDAVVNKAASNSVWSVWDVISQDGLRPAHVSPAVPSDEIDAAADEAAKRVITEHKQMARGMSKKTA